MRVYDKTILINHFESHQNLIKNFNYSVKKLLNVSEVPIRFIVTHSDEKGYYCELTILDTETEIFPNLSSIFNFTKRSFENVEKFNAVLLIPTGIDCEIGGDAGDATPVARLLASVCDHLIIHPNVVNASDINEMPDNCIYVEGSVICRLLMGTVGLKKVRANRVLVLLEEHEEQMITEASINAVSAARATLSMQCAGVIRLKDGFKMTISFSDTGRASGQIEQIENLYDVLKTYRHEYDAIAISSIIHPPGDPELFLKDYYVTESMNPWGGVEAMLTHAISTLLDVPSAHSPMMENLNILTVDVGITDPRKAAEAVSRTYLHCLFKGLHRSPQLLTNAQDRANKEVINAEDISCLVIPEGCLGLPTLAALDQGIPVIAVRENTNLMRNQLENLHFRRDKYFLVNNYLEAVGVMAGLKSGVTPSSVRRPLTPTSIVTPITGI
jgi:hypothetical protein